MKILCVSDQIDPLVYSTTAKERFKDIDAVLCAGDLPSDYIDFIVSTLNKPTYFVFGNHNLNDFYFYHKDQVKSKGPHPTNSVNFQSYDMSHSFGAMYLGFKSIRDKTIYITDTKGKERPLLLAGVSGSIKYNNGLCQYTDRQMFFQLLRLVPSLIYNKIRYGTYLDIFLTHASPRHIHDKEDPCHKGFECFNWFIKRFVPTYLIHGHIHLYDLQSPRVTKVDSGTTVINCYSHYILNINNQDRNE